MIDTANLEIYQGDDYVGLVTVTTVTPLLRRQLRTDLAGYTARAELRAPGAPAIPMSAAITGPDAITIGLTAAQTHELESRHYRWDLQIQSDQGITTTILAGNVWVQLEVTV